MGQKEDSLSPETERNKTQEKVTNINQDLTINMDSQDGQDGGGKGLTTNYAKHAKKWDREIRRWNSLGPGGKDLTAMRSKKKTANDWGGWLVSFLNSRLFTWREMGFIVRHVL